MLNMLASYYFALKRFCSSSLKSKNLMSFPVLESIQSEIKCLQKKHRISSSENSSSKHYKDISKYFNSKQCLRDLKSKIPGKYLEKRLYKTKNFLLVDSDIAGELFNVLKPYLESYTGYILEVNAGLGILTARLLESKLPRLFIYEYDPELRKHLHQLILKNESDARLFHVNLLHLSTMTMQDREDNKNRVGAALDGIHCRSWEDDPAVKVIAAVSTDLFILHIMYSIIFQSGIFAYGRPELFIIMPPANYDKLSAGPDKGPSSYMSKSVLFQILFEHTVLGEVPEQAFLPWLFMNKNQRNARKRKTEENNMYVVRMTARRDLFQRIPPHLIKPLWFFVRLIMQKRKARLIATLEQWIPNCGPRLIAEGHTIFTKCGSLTPEEQLSIFLDCSSWPEFNCSSFIPTMESLLVKLTEPGPAEEVIADSKKNSTTKIVGEKLKELHLYSEES